MKYLNLGCSGRIMKGYVNVDIQKGKGIDKSFDFNTFPYPFDDNIFDYVYAKNILEHLDNCFKVMLELHRICKLGAIIKVIVPYYNCRANSNDITHKHSFNDETFVYLLNPKKHYALKPLNKFEVLSIWLKPTRLGRLIYPFKLRLLLSYVLGEVFSEVYCEIKVLK